MDGCSAQGCFFELTIQLIIIMVGQQLINNILETCIPTITKWLKDRSERKKMEQRYAQHGGYGSCGSGTMQPPQWEVREMT